jgi:NADH-quinone oxidoreductase subunit E
VPAARVLVKQPKAMNATDVPPPLRDLDPEVRGEIDDCVERWSDQEGNLIMILHEIQNRHGYVPRGASLLLAEKTGVPLARIYEVLTFYHYFRLVPQGKHNVTVCNGTACYLKGSARLLAEWESRLGIKEGQTTPDRMFHLETVRCIGCCGMAPSMVVDRKTIGRCTPTDIAGIIEHIRKQEEGHEAAS